MNDTEQAYAAVIKTVRARWRRRLVVIAHTLFFVAMIPFWSHTSWYYDSSGSYIETISPGIPTSVQALWAALLAFHFIWALFAELRDRAIRREIERERKWRLLEQLEEADPYARERILRLADTPDGELIDFDAEAWAENVKRKRG